MNRPILSALTASWFTLAGSSHGWSQAAVPQPPPTDAPPSIVGAAHYDGWYTFNGNLENQKYSQADQITPQNVAKLQKAWEVHTGDVSDGSGKIPLTDWSATPLFVNDTVYVSTPFYRIFAIAPDTGKVKWTYDTHSVLQAVTQPDLKTRGVAYWQAAAPQPGIPCQKIVYVGTMDAKLHAVDADTGKKCEGFADGRTRRQSVEHHQQQMAALPSAAADRLQGHAFHRLGRQGLG
jgi:quinoprotein glucose dehydrogenase